MIARLRSSTGSPGTQNLVELADGRKAGKKPRELCPDCDRRSRHPLPPVYGSSILRASP